MGGSAGLDTRTAVLPTVAGQVGEHGIQGSMSFCTDLGLHMNAVQRGEPGAMEKFLEFADAQVVFTGKITDIEAFVPVGEGR